jgi:hypothetical protein
LAQTSYNPKEPTREVSVSGHKKLDPLRNVELTNTKRKRNASKKQTLAKHQSSETAEWVKIERREKSKKLLRKLNGKRNAPKKSKSSDEVQELPIEQPSTQKEWPKTPLDVFLDFFSLTQQGMFFLPPRR